MNQAFDCVISGGGPSGALLARILSSWGRRVLLLERTGRQHTIPEETLVPSAQEILDRHGLLSVVEAHGAEGPARRGVFWGDSPGTLRDVRTEERGFQVRREGFDEALRHEAQVAGVSRLVGEVRAWKRDPGGVHLSVESALGTESLTVPEWVLAVGRAVLALVGATCVSTRPQTVALSAVIDSDHSLDASVIEAVPQGWWWWLPACSKDQTGRVSLTLFCDAGELREAGRARVWADALQAATGPAHGVGSASGRGTDATARLLQSDQVLLVGDSASTVDPLSSQGLEKALASAESAAYALNTLIEGSVDRHQVLSAHHAWERRLFFAHAETASRYYAREDRFPDTPFWQPRRVSTPTPPDALPGLLHTNPLVRETSVLRRQRRLLAPVAGYVLDRDQDADSAGAGVWEIGGVVLTDVLPQFAEACSVAEFLERARQDPNLCISTPGVLEGILRELWLQGFLLPGSTAETQGSQ